LKPDGAFFLNVGAVPANPLLPHQMALEFSKLFELQNTLHWIKSISVEPRSGEAISVGHFKPINSPRFITDCHEFVFQFTKTGKVPVHRKAVGVPYADKSNIARWGHTGGEDLRCRGNNWFVPYATILSRNKERPHPATFPVELASMCLKLHGLATIEGGGVVLDPFVGIGHAALAAQECGAGRFIGFDIDAIYLSEAETRVAAKGNFVQVELLTVATPPPSGAAAQEENGMLPLFSDELADARKRAPAPPVVKKKRGRPRKIV
jgi:site-specific DNA-methyltransferase (adenine-specific)